MKAVLLFMLISLNLTLLKGQNNWFTNDTEWTYQYITANSLGIEKINLINGEDTIIDNQVYNKIVLSSMRIFFPNLMDTLFYETERYVYEENNIVFTYENNENRVLYNFNLVVGDTLDFMYFGGLNSYRFILDSIGTNEFMGEELSFQDIRIENLDNPTEVLSMRVIEKIGSINSYFFWDFTVLSPPDAPSYYFRCYSDSEIGTINLSLDQVDCDFLIDEVSTIDEKVSDNIKLYPNPINEYIQIENDDIELSIIYIVNAHGEILKTINNNAIKFFQIDFRQYTDGIYFILGFDRLGHIVLNQRVIKS